MGSWATLQVGGTRVAAFKSDVPPEVWMLFTHQDLATRDVAVDGTRQRRVVEFVVPARLMLDRLCALGFGPGATGAAFDQLIEDQLDFERSIAASPTIPQQEPDPVSLLGAWVSNRH